MTLRILHVVPYFPPDKIGGVGEVAYHLHRGLLTRHFDSHVLTTGITKDDPRVHRIAKSAIGFLFFSAFSFPLTKTFDILHFHHGDALSLMLANWLSKRRPSTVCTFHCTCSGIARSHRPYRIGRHQFGWDMHAFLQRFAIGPFRTSIDRLALWTADRPNFISYHGVNDFLGPGHEQTASMIYYGLHDLVERLEHPQQPEIETTELLFVGTSSHRKRIYILPFVLQAIRRHIPAAKIRIIGFARESQPRLDRLFHELRIEDAVVWEGCKLASQLRPYYEASKVLLVPSVHEGLPMVILEAQQCGLPCVATGVSGHPEALIHGVNGFLVDIDNIDAMASHCIDIISDDKLRQRMSNAAQSIVCEKFGLERQVDEYIDLYRNICKAKQKPEATLRPIADSVRRR